MDGDGIAAEQHARRHRDAHDHVERHWRDMREDSSGEQSYADGVAVIRNVEIRARWQAVQNIGLTELCRLTVRGRTLRINSIRNLDESDRVAVIQCTEVN